MQNYLPSRATFFATLSSPPLGRRSMRDEGMVTFNHNAMSFAAKIINYSESLAETKNFFEIPLEIL